MTIFKYLQAISKVLTSYTSPVIVGIAAVTFIYPPLFCWVKGDLQTVILGIIMLTMGMTLSAEDFKILAKRPFDIFIGAVAQYTIMPLIAFAMIKIFNLPPGIAAGLLLVGCCPGGVSSNIITFLSKGDVAFSVGMTTASTLLAPVMTPFLMYYLAGNTIDVNAWAMFKSILIVTILPVAIGVGGLLDFVSGRIPRAPLWMRKANIEWCFRLYCEPIRLFKRYIIGNPLFIARVFRSKLWRKK